MKKILLICAIALFCFTGISQAASNFIEIVHIPLKINMLTVMS